MPMPDPDRLFETDRNGLGRDPGAVDCLLRTRSAVLNVLLCVGSGIAVSGWGLRRRRLGQLPPWGWDLPLTQRGAMAALIGLIALAYVILRLGTSRDRLRDPATRGGRFFRSRVVAAVVAAGAIPLGFVAGWANDPRLEALAPFWIAALGLGFLALPRGHELDDFAEPIAPARPAGPDR